MTRQYLRVEQRSFWLLVREGFSFKGAALELGLNGSAGRRWSRETGGVIPQFVSAPPLQGRYLSLDERIEILVGMKMGLSIRQIARGLGRAPSTVLREVRANVRQLYAARPRTRGLRRHRGGLAGPYRPRLAQLRAEQRASRAARTRPSRLAGNPRLRDRVQGLLEEDYSPEQVAAQLRIEFPNDPEMWVSHETIYKALYVQGGGALRRDLHQRLRTGRAIRKPRRKEGDRQERGRIPGMVNISERPPEADDRAVPGHWEGDLIMGSTASNSAIGTLVERASRFVILLHLPNGHGADAVQEAMIQATATLPTTLRRTLAWDQGKEMTNHIKIAEATGLEIFFCDPHSPWQRGSNENTNGLLRQYFPKGTDISIYPADYLAYVALKLNRRPRKTLDWQNPAERLDELLSNPTNPNGVASLA